MVYSLAEKLISMEKYNLHSSVTQGVKLLFPATLRNCTQIAIKSGILKEKDQTCLTFSKKALHNEYDFHTIRLKNILKVQLNEMRTFKSIQEAAKSISKKPIAELKKEAVSSILDKMLLDYEKDYKKYYSKKFSKPKQIGCPFYLEAKNKKIGIVLCHGYKASPAEVHLLAKYLNKNGYNVLVPRLRGHGTSPINMKDITYQDWQESLNEAYAVLRQSCDKVILVGFSTGGLLSLCCAAQNYVDGIVCINAALQLNDIRINYIGVINFWNQLLKVKKQYIDAKPEYPHTNYSRNYLKGVEELKKLMEQTNVCATHITCPALIIQARKDPVVNPKSGQEIYKTIKSKVKYLYEPDLKHHVIVRGEGHKETFETIHKFIHNKIK
jgi:esterase/lipase